jgi:hypothetical protein
MEFLIIIISVIIFSNKGTNSNIYSYGKFNIRADSLLKQRWSIFPSNSVMKVSPLENENKT